jgi:hypothetical protein
MSSSKLPIQIVVDDADCIAGINWRTAMILKPRCLVNAALTGHVGFFRRRPPKSYIYKQQ